MPGPTKAEIDAAGAVYDQAIADRETKKSDRNAKFGSLQDAETQFEVAQTAYSAATAAAINAELEWQRLNDEHTADVEEPPVVPEPTL